MKACVLVPLYDHGEPFEAVAEGLAKLGLPCLVVDDGSAEETRRRLARLLERHAWLEVHRRAVNGGRGAALKTGYRLAAERGFSHAVQLDADGQHDPLDVPRLLDAARARPEALVLGAPIFDASVPKSRLYGRQLSRAMVWLTTASFAVRDPLCGFRVIPLAPTLALLDRAPLGDRMEFDPELVIALCRSGGYKQLSEPIRDVGDFMPVIAFECDIKRVFAINPDINSVLDRLESVRWQVTGCTGISSGFLCSSCQ